MLRMHRAPATPPYAALAARIRTRIQREALPPGAWLGTEVGLAEENNIARMTARRAVQILVDEGLVERRAGRGIFVRGSGTATRKILFLAGDMLWTPAVRVSQAVQAAAPDLGIEVILFDAGGDLAAFLRRLSSLPGDEFVGAIAMSQHDPAFNRALAGLVAAEFPVVVVDQKFSDLEVPCVTSDNRAGGRLAAEALLTAGHRRLAFLGDRADTSLERERGAMEACSAAEIPAPLSLTCTGARFADWTPQLGALLRDAVSKRNRPTALFCSCDAVARIALRTLADAGLSVPRDMSIMGFDDDPIAEWTTPTLSTVRQNFPDMGRSALDLLAKRIAEPTAPAERVAIPVTVVPRDSISNPPKP